MRGAGPRRFGPLLWPRHTMAFRDNAEKAGHDLSCAIVIGASPAELLASQAIAPVLVLAPVAVAALRAVLRGAMHHLEHLEAAAGADGDAGERRLGELRWHLRLVAEPLVEAGEECSSAGGDGHGFYR